MSSIFGNILSSNRIEDAVESTLKTWFRDYLLEVERVNGLPQETLPVPVNYTKRNSFDVVKGERVPKVVVISPGIIGQPQKNGKQYRAIWSLGVGVAMSASSEELANQYDKMYGAAVRAILLQQTQWITDFGDFSLIESIWLEENYNDLAITAQSSFYRAVSVFFAFDIEDVVSRWSGPTEPNGTPYPPLGEAQLVDIVLQKDPIT